MQVRAGIGMAPRDILIEFDAQAWLAGRDHVARLPADRLLQDLRVKPAPGLEALEDQEIRAASADLDIGGALDRPTVEMRRDLRVVRLRHARDLLGLHQP